MVIKKIITSEEKKMNNCDTRLSNFLFLKTNTLEKLCIKLILANAPYTRSFLTCTQHIFLISKNALNFGNKNLELKIIYFGKINPKVVIEFWK